MASQQESSILAVRERLIHASSSNYLTLLSVIQGVALAYLATVVATSNIAGHGFSTAQWLMAVLTLFLFIIIWDSILIDTVVLTLIPDLTDAILPFVAGAVELLACQAVALASRHGIRLWLGAIAITACFGAYGFHHVPKQARREPENEPFLHEIAPDRDQLNQGQIGAAAVCSFIALSSLVAPFGTAKGGATLMAFVAVALVGAIMIISFLAFLCYWSKVVAFAQPTQTNRTSPTNKTTVGRQIDSKTVPAEPVSPAPASHYSTLADNEPITPKHAPVPVAEWPSWIATIVMPLQVLGRSLALAWRLLAKLRSLVANHRTTVP